jgi:hypothetical protein
MMENKVHFENPSRIIINKKTIRDRKSGIDRKIKDPQVIEAP